jgi:hypothetical protein
MKKKRVRITFEVPEVIHRAIKIAATDECISMRMYLLRLILEKLAKDKYIRINEP